MCRAMHRRSATFSTCSTLVKTKKGRTADRQVGEPGGPPPGIDFRSADHAVGAQRPDLGIGIARVAQYVLAVLANGGGGTRSRLLLTSDPDRAVDGQRTAIGKRYHRLAGKDLFVIGDLVHIGDDAEDQAGLVENAAPLELILGREDLVHARDQLARMGLSRRRGGKARIIERA